MVSPTPANVPICTPTKNSNNNTISPNARASTTTLPTVSDSKTSASTSTSTPPPKTVSDPTNPSSFFRLSRELRDMIYDHPCLLEERFLLAQNEYPPSEVYDNNAHNRLRLHATKPRTNLRLVSKKFDAEYSSACQGRLELFVRAHPYRFLLNDQFLLNGHDDDDNDDDGDDNNNNIWSAQASSQLNILHLHLGAFGFAPLAAPEDVMCELETFAERLTVLCARLPRLRSVHLKLYISNCSVGLGEFEAWLRDLVSSMEGKLEALKIILCSDPEKCWDLADTEKTVVVDWKKAGGEGKGKGKKLNNAPPALLTGDASSLPYAESCCEGLNYDSPRVGEMMRDELGDYLGVMGDDGEIAMPIPYDLLSVAGLEWEDGTAIPLRWLRENGFGAYVDGGFGSASASGSLAEMDG